MSKFVSLIHVFLFFFFSLLPHFGGVRTPDAISKREIGVFSFCNSYHSAFGSLYWFFKFFLYPIFHFFVILLYFLEEFFNSCIPDFSWIFLLTSITRKFYQFFLLHPIDSWFNCSLQWLLLSLKWLFYIDGIPHQVL